MTRGILVEKKIVLVFHAATFSHFTRGKKKNEPIILNREELDFLCEGYQFFFSVFDNNKIL